MKSYTGRCRLGVFFFCLKIVRRRCQRAPFESALLVNGQQKERNRGEGSPRCGSVRDTIKRDVSFLWTPPHFLFSLSLSPGRHNQRVVGALCDTQNTHSLCELCVLAKELANAGGCGGGEQHGLFLLMAVRGGHRCQAPPLHSLTPLEFGPLNISIVATCAMFCAVNPRFSWGRRSENNPR